jgi:hypothetical protein
VNELPATDPLRSSALRQQAIAGRSFDFSERRGVLARNERFQNWRTEARRRYEPDGSWKGFPDDRQVVEHAC